LRALRRGGGNSIPVEAESIVGVVLSIDFSRSPGFVELQLDGSRRFIISPVSIIVVSSLPYRDRQIGKPLKASDKKQAPSQSNDFTNVTQENLRLSSVVGEMI
jgi:hypothetical protein